MIDFPNMYAKGKPLITDADIQNAIWFRTWIAIYRHGMLIDHGGLVEKFDEHSVSINGGFFLRKNWQLIVQ